MIASIRRFALGCTLIPGVFSASAAFAQKPSPAVAVRNANRVAVHPDMTTRVQLSGHLPAWVNAQNEAGPANLAEVMQLDVMVSRAPAVQADFDQLLADQQNPASPRYHQWLTPQQIGQQYGPTQADLDALTGWLTAQGLTVASVSPGRTFVHVSAPVSTVAAAFGTSFKMFSLTTDVKASASLRAPRLSATSEPTLPMGLMPIVSGIVGLTDIPAEPMHRMEIHEIPAPSAGGAQPQLTTSAGNHYVLPADFAKIYNLPAAYNGAGQKVAIVGRSQVAAADITNFEAFAGLPSKVHNTIVPPGATDPGFAGAAGGDQGEATLDVQRVLGTAPGATADLIIASSNSGGIATAIQYNINTLLDPILTISFGACETLAGQNNVAFYQNLFSQAAAEGISVFVSSGDSGGAGCDAHGTAPPTTTQFASTNYICSSGFATCVGGTQFNDTANPNASWNTTNDATTHASALGYIAEGVWNEPVDRNGNYQIGAGGGGVSQFVTKPAFQVGSGVPADGFRDEPDLSFTASGHDGYFGCIAQSSGAASCIPAANGSIGFTSFAGTSASTPAMAAIAAILNQRLGAKQGNLNPLIYRLAATPSNNVFHDTTIASSGVTNCVATTPSLCNNSTPGPTSLTGGYAGNLLTAGYDLASGWGSMDVTAFLTASAVGTGTATTTTLTGTTGNVATGAALTYTATLAPLAGPTGTVQFYASGNALGTPQTVSAGKATLAIANPLAVGTYAITAVYGGDSNYQISTSSALQITVTAGGTIVTTPVLTSTPANTTPTTNTILAAIINHSTGSAVPTGNVTLNQVVNGQNNAVTTLSLTNGTASAAFTFPAGSYVLNISYSGDAVYAPATSANITVVSVGPGFTLAPSPASLTFAAGATTGNTDILTLAATGGFSGSVVITCSISPVPANYPAVCVPPANPLAVGITAAAGTITITSTLPRGSLGKGFVSTTPGPLDRRNAERTAGGLVFALLLALIPAGSRRRLAQSGRLLTLLLILGASSLLMLSGCGSGGSASSTIPLVGTTPGAYTVTVTATGTPTGGGATVTNTLAIPLTIQ